MYKLCPFAKAAANAATALQPPPDDIDDDNNDNNEMQLQHVQPPRLLPGKRPGWQYQPLYSWLVVL